MLACILQVEESIYEAYEEATESREAVRIAVKEKYYRKMRRRAEAQRLQMLEAAKGTIRAQRSARHISETFEFLMELTNSSSPESLVQFFETTGAAIGNFQGHADEAVRRREELNKEYEKLHEELQKWAFGGVVQERRGKMPYVTVIVDVASSSRPFRSLP